MKQQHTCKVFDGKTQSMSQEDLLKMLTAPQPQMLVKMPLAVNPLSSGVIASPYGYK